MSAETNCTLNYIFRKTNRHTFVHISVENLLEIIIRFKEYPYHGLWQTCFTYTDTNMNKFSTYFRSNLSFLSKRDSRHRFLEIFSSAHAVHVVGATWHKWILYYVMLGIRLWMSLRTCDGKTPENFTEINQMSGRNWTKKNERFVCKRSIHQIGFGKKFNIYLKHYSTLHTKNVAKPIVDIRPSSKWKYTKNC